MKTNLLYSLKRHARDGEKPIEPKSNLTILFLLFVALALAGCEGMESGSSGDSSPWPAAPTGHSASQTGFAAGLSGRWYHDGKPTSIDVAPDGRNLTVIDEVGRRTDGYVTSPGEFLIPRDNLRGRLSHDGRRISWTNGGEWTREPRGSNSGQGLSGRWYHDGRPTSIDVAPNGRNLTVIDEVGRRTSGYVTSPGEFTIPQDHLQGRLSHDGRRISWTNGGTWTR